MTIWIDAQMSPAIAKWISERFAVKAVGVRDLGLESATDITIFNAARDNKAVVMTKDSDFVLLLEKFGPPPQIIWITSGNTSNLRLQEILSNTFREALELLKSGEALVEIGASDFF